MLSVCSYFIKICWDGMKQDYLEDGWKQVNAVVLDQDIDLKGKKNEDRTRDGLEQTLNYEYRLDDILYQSNSVSPELFINKEDYAKGQSITVYYNPNNREDSVVIRTPVKKQYLIAFIVFCLIVIAVVFISLVRDFKNS